MKRRRRLRRTRWLVPLVLLLSSACAESEETRPAPPDVETKVEQPPLPRREVFGSPPPEVDPDTLAAEQPAAQLEVAHCVSVRHFGPGESALQIDVAANRATGMVLFEAVGRTFERALSADGTARQIFRIQSFGSYPYEVGFDGRTVITDSIEVTADQVMCNIQTEADRLGITPGRAGISSEAEDAFVDYPEDEDDPSDVTTFFLLLALGLPLLVIALWALYGTRAGKAVAPDVEHPSVKGPPPVGPKKPEPETETDTREKDDWPEEDGDGGTLDGGTIFGPREDEKKPKVSDCDDLQNRCRELTEKANSERARAEAARTRATELQQSAREAQATIDAAKAARDAVGVRPEGSWMEDARGRLTSEDLGLERQEAKDAFAQFKAGKITGQQLQQQWGKWAEPGAIQRLGEAARAAKQAALDAAQKDVSDAIAREAAAMREAITADAEATVAERYAAQAAAQADSACAAAADCYKAAGVQPPG